MKAMILAAGRGERMRPLTDKTPKPLLPIDGKPMIERHIEALVEAGLVRIVINLAWLGEQIRQYLGDGRRFGAELVYSEEAEALETAGGIVQALPLLGERFVVVNADIVSDFDFSALLDVGAPAHIVLVPNPPQHLGGDFGLDHGRVSNRHEPRYTFSGIACYHRSFFASVAPGRRPLAPMLRQAADSGSLSGELYEGYWADIGTVERLRQHDPR